MWGVARTLPAIMNDSQVKQQIQQMVSFIRQEAEEKAAEIGVKAEEDFNIRKLSAVEAAREKIRAEYERKTKLIEVNRKMCVVWRGRVNPERRSHRLWCGTMDAPLVVWERLPTPSADSYLRDRAECSGGLIPRARLSALLSHAAVPRRLCVLLT